MEVIQVTHVLILIPVMEIDDADHIGQRKPLFSLINGRLIDALFQDFIANVVITIDVKAFLVHPELDVQRAGIGKDQLGGAQGHRGALR